MVGFPFGFSWSKIPYFCLDRKKQGTEGADRGSLKKRALFYRGFLASRALLNRSATSFRASSVISRFSRSGFEPIRYGHRAQVIAVQRRTSMICSPQQSRHLARITDKIGFAWCPHAPNSDWSIARGSRPTACFSLGSVSKYVVILSSQK